MTVQPTTPMPTDGTYGKVVGRYLLAVADATDPDRLPDAIAAKGDITFTPTQPNIKMYVPKPTTVVRTQIKCSVDNDGNLIDPQGGIGVWLMAGVYKVNYGLSGVSSLVGPTIEVLSTHTEENPLDLTIVTSSGGKTVTPSEYFELSSLLATKAKSTDLDLLSIEILSKADQSDLDGLAEQIVDFSDDIQAKASQTSVTALADRVETLEQSSGPAPLMIAYDTDGAPYLTTQDSAEVIDGSDPSFTATESIIAYDLDGTPYLVDVNDALDGGGPNQTATAIVDGGAP